MRLVDAEVVHGDEDVDEIARPPRPEKRRVYVSLFFTFSVLVATVITVYGMFPERHIEILTATIAEHRVRGDFEIDEPTLGELKAWSVGVLHELPPWPTGEQLVVVGARRFKILRREAVFARFRVQGDDVSFALVRARDAPPRKHRRHDEDLFAVSWRNGGWTCIAVGPESAREVWGPLVGAP